MCAQNFHIWKFLCFIRDVRSVHVIHNRSKCGKRGWREPSTSSSGQLQEKADHAVSPADSFTTSEELAREERNESWDDRIQAEPS